MKKMSFLFFNLLIANITIGQYYGLPYYYVHSDGFGLVDKSSIFQVSSDTVIISDCPIFNKDSISYNCIFDCDILCHYNDNSYYKYFYKEKGTLIQGKKFGKWYAESGRYIDSIRKIDNKWIEYFINDYEIPYATEVSEKIVSDIPNRKTTCILTHYGNEVRPDIKIKLEYFPNNSLDTTFVKCSTLDEKEIFITTTENIQEEIKLLIDGYYNRKIYVR